MEKTQINKNKYTDKTLTVQIMSSKQSPEGLVLLVLSATLYRISYMVVVTQVISNVT